MASRTPYPADTPLTDRQWSDLRSVWSEQWGVLVGLSDELETSFVDGTNIIDVAAGVIEALGVRIAIAAQSIPVSGPGTFWLVVDVSLADIDDLTSTVPRQVDTIVATSADRVMIPLVRYTIPASGQLAAATFHDARQWLRKRGDSALIGTLVPSYAPVTQLPAGLLRCDGSTFDPVTYPDLAALFPNHRTPDLVGRILRGDDPSDIVGEGRYPGETFGSDSHVLDYFQAPVHGHTLDHDHVDTAGDGGHTHPDSLTGTPVVLFESDQTATLQGLMLQGTEIPPGSGNYPGGSNTRFRQLDAAAGHSHTMVAQTAARSSRSGVDPAGPIETIPASMAVDWLIVARPVTFRPPYTPPPTLDLVTGTIPAGANQTLTVSETHDLDLVTGTIPTGINGFLTIDPAGDLTPPVVEILSPLYADFVAGDAVRLEVSAVDDTDGDISHLVTWSSNLSPNIGTGALVFATSLPEELQSITATAVDAAGNIGQQTIAVNVTPRNVPLGYPAWGGFRPTSVGRDQAGNQTADIDIGGNYFRPKGATAWEARRSIAGDPHRFAGGQAAGNGSRRWALNGNGNVGGILTQTDNAGKDWTDIDSGFGYNANYGQAPRSCDDVLEHDGFRDVMWYASTQPTTTLAGVRRRDMVTGVVTMPGAGTIGDVHGLAIEHSTGRCIVAAETGAYVVDADGGGYTKLATIVKAWAVVWVGPYAYIGCDDPAAIANGVYRIDMSDLSVTEIGGLAGSVYNKGANGPTAWSAIEARYIGGNDQVLVGGVDVPKLTGGVASWLVLIEDADVGAGTAIDLLNGVTVTYDGAYAWIANSWKLGFNGPTADRQAGVMALSWGEDDVAYAACDTSGMHKISGLATGGPFTVIPDGEGFAGMSFTDMVLCEVTSGDRWWLSTMADQDAMSLVANGTAVAVRQQISGTSSAIACSSLGSMHVIGTASNNSAGCDVEYLVTGTAPTAQETWVTSGLEAHLAGLGVGGAGSGHRVEDVHLVDLVSPNVVRCWVLLTTGQVLWCDITSNTWGGWSGLINLGTPTTTPTRNVAHVIRNHPTDPDMVALYHRGAGVYASTNASSGTPSFTLVGAYGPTNAVDEQRTGFVACTETHLFIGSPAGLDRRPWTSLFAEQFAVTISTDRIGAITHHPITGELWAAIEQVGTTPGRLLAWTDPDNAVDTTVPDDRTIPGWKVASPLVTGLTPHGSTVAAVTQGSSALTLASSWAASPGEVLIDATTQDPATQRDVGESGDLTATAFDKDGADISASTAWSSDREGPIGTGATVAWSPTVAGPHAITATADGAVAQFNTVVGKAPLYGIIDRRKYPASGYDTALGGGYVHGNMGDIIGGPDPADINLDPLRAGIGASSGFDDFYGSGKPFMVELYIGALSGGGSSHAATHNATNGYLRNKHNTMRWYDSGIVRTGSGVSMPGEFGYDSGDPGWTSRGDGTDEAQYGTCLAMWDQTPADITLADTGETLSTTIFVETVARVFDALRTTIYTYDGGEPVMFADVPEFYGIDVVGIAGTIYPEPMIRQIGSKVEVTPSGTWSTTTSAKDYACAPLVGEIWPGMVGEIGSRTFTATAAAVDGATIIRGTFDQAGATFGPSDELVVRQNGAEAINNGYSIANDARLCRDLATAARPLWSLTGVRQQASLNDMQQYVNEFNTRTRLFDAETSGSTWPDFQAAWAVEDAKTTPTDTTLGLVRHLREMGRGVVLGNDSIHGNLDSNGDGAPEPDTTAGQSRWSEGEATLWRAEVSAAVTYGCRIGWQTINTAKTEADYVDNDPVNGYPRQAIFGDGGAGLDGAIETILAVLADGGGLARNRVWIELPGTYESAPYFGQANYKGVGLSPTHAQLLADRFEVTP